LSVVIHDFNIRRAVRAFFPGKANSPLVINTDAVLPAPLALQCFETISGQSGEVSQVHRTFQPVQFQPCGKGNAVKLLNAIASGKTLSILVRKASNHSLVSHGGTRYVKRSEGRYR
jgi:hypothetical protein